MGRIIVPGLKQDTWEEGLRRGSEEEGLRRGSQVTAVLLVLTDSIVPAFTYLPLRQSLLLSPLYHLSSSLCFSNFLSLTISCTST